MPPSDSISQLSNLYIEASSTMSHIFVTAEYKSPNGPHAFNTPSATPAQSNGTSLTAAEQANHLHSIRTSVANLQTDVNTFLTQKMEEDKGSSKAEDAKAEENYGEEVPDDSDENADKPCSTSK